MNSERSNESDFSDARLSALLKTWMVDAPVPPRFQQNVWRRIESQETRGSWLNELRQLFERHLARPVLVGSYLLLLLGVGLGTGYVQARQANSHLRDTLQSRYMQSVDPYQRVAAYHR